MLDPECYIGAYQLSDGQWKTTKFRDQVDCEGLHTGPHTLWDRKPLYCIRPTGQSKWTEETVEPAVCQAPAAGGRSWSQTSSAVTEI